MRILTSINIETRIANRLKSVFAAFGQTVNDFYLEAGIYFVGGFNAALVAWDIYTSLVIDGQPLAYAVTLAIIAFIAVEGLAVYLVGAAAKTGNGWLWFFSVIFAAFFTYAHYREMSGPGVIAQYITLAIPPFVVIGYWARTVKVDIETGQAQRAQKLESELTRRRQLEDEERKRRRQVEDENRDHKRQLDRLKLEQKQVQNLAQLEVQKSVQFGQKSVQMNQMNRQNDMMNHANEPRQSKKMNRQNDLANLVETVPDLGPTELTRRLNEMGHSASISTIKRDIKQLNGSIQGVK
jgi:hypothetical protein